jgi:acyl carrier protein
VIQAEQVSRELRDFIVEHFMYGRRAQLGDDESLLENGLIDSTGVLELVTKIEETYGFSVEDNELVPENLDSVSALTRFVERKLNPAAK